jgi:hypothetical protein
MSDASVSNALNFCSNPLNVLLSPLFFVVNWLQCLTYCIPAGACSSVAMTVVIQDVKHCNQLTTKNKGLNNTFKGLEQKFKALETDASDIHDNSHKKDTISKALEGCKKNLQGIKPLFDERTRHLEKSLEFHETMSHLNSELCLSIGLYVLSFSTTCCAKHFY